MEVFTDEWARACCERLNQRETYRTAAAAWEGGIVLAMSAAPAQGIAAERAIYIDAHRGECRGARVASEDELASAPFVFSATPDVWRRLLAKEMEPVSAVVQGKLRLVRGSMMTLMKFTQAAREMVAAAADVGGTFPAAGG